MLTKSQKAEILQDLATRFDKAKSIVFTVYRGLSVADVTNLRRSLRKEKIDLQVAKKTLVEKVFAEKGLTDLAAALPDGPLAVAFSYEDQVLVTKLLHDFAKKSKILVVGGGVLDGKVITAEMVRQLAILPSKKELLAKLLGSMKSPVSGFYGVTSGLIRGLMQVLKGQQEKLSA